MRGGNKLSKRSRVVIGLKVNVNYTQIIYSQTSGG